MIVVPQTCTPLTLLILHFTALTLFSFPLSLLYTHSSPTQSSALKTTKFCLCARGNKAWSPRLMDALWFGCIPVLIADHYIPPLTELLDWRNISVVVPESQVYLFLFYSPSYSSSPFISPPPPPSLSFLSPSLPLSLSLPLSSSLPLLPLSLSLSVLLKQLELVHHITHISGRFLPYIG